MWKNLTKVLPFVCGISHLITYTKIYIIPNYLKIVLLYQKKIITQYDRSKYSLSFDCLKFFKLQIYPMF